MWLNIYQNIFSSNFLYTCFVYLYLKFTIDCIKNVFTTSLLIQLQIPISIQFLGLNLRRLEKSSVFKQTPKQNELPNHCLGSFSQLFLLVWLHASQRKRFWSKHARRSSFPPTRRFTINYLCKGTNFNIISVQCKNIENKIGLL